MEEWLENQKAGWNSDKNCFNPLFFYAGEIQGEIKGFQRKLVMV